MDSYKTGSEKSVPISTRKLNLLIINKLRKLDHEKDNEFSSPHQIVLTFVLNLNRDL